MRGTERSVLALSSHIYVWLIARSPSSSLDLLLRPVYSSIKLSALYIVRLNKSKFMGLGREVEGLKFPLLRTDARAHAHAHANIKHIHHGQS